MENPYQGSRAVPDEGRVTHTAFRIFGRRVLRGATFGAILLAGLALAMVLYARSLSPESEAAQELWRNMRAWSDVYAFGMTPLVSVPLLYGVVGVMLGSVLGTLYHFVAQFARLLFRRWR